MADQRLGFYFDQTLCTGCKACQIACKDKHDTPIGVDWRRVVEYSGGGWQRNSDDTFTNSVFTYYTSMACNHCQDAPCIDVCPTTAMTRREDGTVYVDQDKCVGCEYCSWVCPYGAPQINKETGRMSKCDLCYDYRQEGRIPACVEACPSRALDWGPLEELQQQYTGVTDIAPLAEGSITNPNLVIKPHRDAEPSGHGTGAINNPKEI